MCRSFAGSCVSGVLARRCAGAHADATGFRHGFTRACGTILGFARAFTGSRGIGLVLNVRCCSGCGHKFRTGKDNTPASSFSSLDLASGKRKGHAVGS